MRKVLIVVLIGLLFAGCEKDEPDYRVKYVGTYACSYEETFIINSDIRYNKGADTIEVGFVDDSMLYFKSIPNGDFYYDSDKGHIMVGVDGTFILRDYWWETKAEGRFFDDSILINHTNSHKWEESKMIIKGKKMKL